jgi:hypothetical protein
MTQGNEAIVLQMGLKIGEMLGKKIVIGACRKDMPDDLDERPFVPQAALSQLPASVDLRRWMTPVEDQGSMGSCTSNAMAGALEYLIFRQTGQHADISRLFLYYNQRLFGREVRQDAGSQIKHAVRVASRLGAPHEKMWPYHPDLFAVQPPESVYRAAAQHRVVDYNSVPLTEHAMKAALAAGFPVLFGTSYFDSCFKAAGKTGVMPSPAAGEESDGGHAMLVVGYDDGKHRFLIRNSWGDDWGESGYYWMNYTDFLDPERTHGTWMVRLAADLTFEEAEHVTVDLAALPKAPPPGDEAAAPAESGSLFDLLARVGSGGGNPLFAVANEAASNSVSMLTSVTGNAMAGNLLGGVVQGVMPSLLGDRLDPGVIIETDYTEAIWAALHGEGLTAPVIVEAHRPSWAGGASVPAGSDQAARASHGGAPLPDAPAAPEAAGLLTHGKGKAYLFHQGNYARVDLARRSMDEGYPMSIADGWAGVWPEGVDAAVWWPGGKIHFFKGDEYTRFDLENDRADEGYPMKIGPNWPGLWPEGIDAGIVWPNGKAYFFKGDEYIRYDIAADRADEGYPMKIAPGWPGLWPDAIAAVVPGAAGRVYFLRGQECLALRVADESIPEGYPRPIDDEWQGAGALFEG